jgi:hypothetical protein
MSVFQRDGGAANGRVVYRQRGGQAQPLCSARDGLRTLAATLAVHDAAVGGTTITLKD